MDPTVTLWILGSITVGFIALLPMVFIILTLLISRFSQEYLTKKEFIADMRMAAFKVLSKRRAKKKGSKRRAKKKGKITDEEISKILMKTRAGGLLMGAIVARIFFLGSIILVAYCLFIMQYVKMGSDFPSIFVSIAIVWAISLLGILFHRIGWGLRDIIIREFGKALEKL